MNIYLCCIVYISLLQISWVQYMEFHFIFTYIVFFRYNHFETESVVLSHQWGFWYKTPIVDLLIMPQWLSRVNQHYLILSLRSGALSLNLNNYFNFHVCLSIRVCVCVRVSKKVPFSEVVSQNVTNISCLVYVKYEKYASWVPSDPSWTAAERGKAKLCMFNFKTTRSEFQKPSQTAPAEAKSRCVYSILKPHGQRFIYSPGGSPKQLCALAHLGCSRAAGTS